MTKLIIPLIMLGGGLALAIGDAKASAKKKKVSNALDLGLDTPDEQPNLPEPPSETKAYPVSPINRESFQQWWYQTDWSNNGVMGFYVEVTEPQAGTQWLIPGIQYPDAVVVTGDGAFWYFDDGWHPAHRLSQDYDAWYQSGGPLEVP